ncbi:protein kinase family protein [Mycobacterium tilburgii]|uniref:hypothetical protein n=1 Tax=Mycobacterium tilburgii TaxID=44467 RepID=UPI00118293EA|nr:hypothetical protein [Mycobacterium tilburgii]
MISLPPSSDGRFRRRFLEETATVTSLRHPHIVAVHHRSDLDARLWIAMDYVEGSSAAQLMRDRFPAVWPTGEVLAIVARSPARWTTPTSAAFASRRQAGQHPDDRPARG